jgi:hypothetical protein
MVAIGTVMTKNKEGVLLFEEHNSEIKPLRKLHQVWVRVFGVPMDVRSFLPLWAVDTILGATQKVDISYLRKTGVVRLLVADLDANAVPKDADVVVNRSMYRIFFKVDEVVRDEDDFNLDDDYLLADDDQAKDQDMEDMDESEPFGENETNPAHQTNSTNAFNDDEGEIYKTMELVHDEVTKLGEEQGRVNEMVVAYVAGIDKIPHSEGGGIIEYSAEAIEEPRNRDDDWKQGLVMVTSVVEVTEGVQQMQHESVASDVAVLPDTQHEVEAAEDLCLNVEPADAAADMSVAPDAAMIMSLGAIAKATHTDMEKRTAGEMLSAVQDETRVASFKVVSGSEALGGVVLLGTEEEDIGLTAADPVVKIQGEEEDAPSVSEGIEALLSGSTNNPVRQEVPYRPRLQVWRKSQ